MSTLDHFFAPCPRGLAGMLALEIKNLGGQYITETEAGVGFSATLPIAYAVNLHSRIASRVLWQRLRFSYRKEDDIYQAVLAHDWPAEFDISCTIKVEINATKCPLKSLDFITLRVKDAVCDRFRQINDERPSVDARKPDVRIHTFLDATTATIYLDLSGEPLFKRGSREHTGEAPLKKNLAAGILMLSGWQPGMTLLDPMCGSGTFLVEAAQMSLNMAPGLDRPFAFEKLNSYDNKAWQAYWEAAKNKVLPPEPLPIFGSDLFGYALADAERNLAENGLDECVALKQANVLEVSAPAAEGILITNPPYGIRIGDSSDLNELYPKLGDVLKKKFAGWNAYIFTADGMLPKLMRLSVSRKTPLFNGKLECRLYEYKLVAGSNRKPETGSDQS